MKRVFFVLLLSASTACTSSQATRDSDDDDESYTPEPSYYCGNGVLEAEYGEQCDDANEAGLDGCELNCRLTYQSCGNSMLDPGEICFDAHGDFGSGVWSPSEAAFGDVDGDSDLDAAVTHDYGVRFARNGGNGSFASQANLASGENPGHLAFADLDGDFDLDLAVASRMSDTLLFYRNDGGTLAPWTVHSFEPYEGPGVVLAGDVDDDGDHDLVLTLGDPGQLRLWRHDGAGNFVETLIMDAAPHEAELVDINGDGLVDVVGIQYGSAGITIALNLGPDGAGGILWSSDIQTTGISHAEDFATGDFDLDGDLDIALIDQDPDDLVILLNDGAAGFGFHLNYWLGFGAHEISAADFDADGDTDVVTLLDRDFASEWAEPPGPTILVNDGDASFHIGFSYPSKTPWPVLAAPDVTGDEKPDVVDIGNDIRVLPSTP